MIEGYRINSRVKFEQITSYLHRTDPKKLKLTRAKYFTKQIGKFLYTSSCRQLNHSAY